MVDHLHNIHNPQDMVNTQTFQSFHTDSLHPEQKRIYAHTSIQQVTNSNVNEGVQQLDTSEIKWGAASLLYCLKYVTFVSN